MQFFWGKAEEGDKGGRVLNSLSENQLIEIWQHQLMDRAGLVTEDGKPVKIIYPGRLNDEPGADFRDAVITADERLIKGDVEIHVKSGDWCSHQHHRDQVYNRVILHVVMWHNAKTTTELQNGRQVSILALHKYIKVPVSQRLDSASSSTTLSVPCLEIARHVNMTTIAEFLDKVGEERFLNKAGRFQRDLAQMEAGKCLYQGIMEALGYSKNKLPMLELARRLPIRVLESMIEPQPSDGEYLARQQALLLGTAGLLPMQCQDRCQGIRLDDEWIDELQGLWTSLHQPKAMPSAAWSFFKVRPYNSPVCRLVAMSYLLLRYREKGLLQELVSLVETAPVNRGCRELERGLLVTADDCRASYISFSSGSRIKSPTLLGRGRAADITVNVLLPFTFAWGLFTSRPELARKAFDVYRLYPRLAVNSVERHMVEQLGLRRGLVNSAKWQQGLIHTYKNLCSQGRCSNCSLSQLQAGNYIQR